MGHNMVVYWNCRYCGTDNFMLLTRVPNAIKGERVLLVNEIGITIDAF
jgi:hypothetical protein